MQVLYSSGNINFIVGIRNCRNFTIDLDISRNSDFNAIPDNLDIYCQNRGNFIIALSKHSRANVSKTRASKNCVKSEKLTSLQESKKILRLNTLAVSDLEAQRNLILYWSHAET